MGLVSLLSRWSLRSKARSGLRKLPAGRRRVVREIAADAFRECRDESEVPLYAERRASAVRFSGASNEPTRFGFAEILLVIQIVVAIYKLLKAIGVLREEATESRVAREVGDV